MLMKNIEKILEPFNLGIGKKQDLGTLLIHLRDNKVSMDEIIDYIEDLKKNIQKNQKKQNKKRDQWLNIALKCPECNTIMQLSQVNDHTGNQVGGNWKSQWFCPKCGYDIYNKETVNEVVQLRIGGRDEL